MVSGNVSRIREYRIEIDRVRCGLGFYFMLMHSLTQKVSIVAYAYKAVSYKNCMLALVRACPLKLLTVSDKDQ